MRFLFLSALLLVPGACASEPSDPPSSSAELTEEEPCGPESESCATLGKCAPAPESAGCFYTCVAASDADCVASRWCEEKGRCCLYVHPDDGCTECNLCF